MQSDQVAIGPNPVKELGHYSGIVMFVVMEAFRFGPVHFELAPSHACHTSGVPTRDKAL